VNKIKRFLILIVCFISIFLIFKFFISSDDSLNQIKSRGVLLVGTTGDYCPMSCFDKTTNSYVGFDIELAEDLAKSLGVKLQYVETSWPTLMDDVKQNKFDVAISGITITDDRKKQAFMSNGYLENGKTVLCRKSDANKYASLEAINNQKVRVMENPGGLNEKFARENLPNSNIIIHNVNYEIPQLIASGKADVMITEIIEANYYSSINRNLAAPLADTPFTRGQIGMLIPSENKNFVPYLNKFIENEQKNGRLAEIKKKYIYSNKPLIKH
jgi:cyclohexadienyl dehydratase